MAPQSTPTRRAVGLRPTVVCLPVVMALQEQRFDGCPVLAGTQLLIIPAVRQVGRCIQIGMRLLPTDDTTKRLLVGAIGSIWIVTHMALLRGIRTLDLTR